VRIVDIREGAVSLRSELRNAAIDFSEMDTSVVAVVTDVVRDGRPLAGYGFNSNGRYAQRGILRERLIPRILSAPPEELLDETGTNFDAQRIWGTMMRNEKPGGHGERAVAVAAIDMAVFDLVAKVAGMPLFRWLAHRHGEGDPDTEVFVYAAGGYYYPGRDFKGLQEELRGYLDAGYTVVKMKIGGASLDEDLARVESALEIVGDGSRLAVDANGRFDLETAVRYAKALASYDLFWFEEAGDPLDYELQAQLAQLYDGPLATGENLFSAQDGRNLLRYAGLRSDRDWIQIDPALSYGLVEYLRFLDVMKELGWSPRRCVPHGGHQFALHVAAGLHLGGNESYPGVFFPIGGFADEAAVTDGRIGLTEDPGIGIERKAELYGVFRELVA
jgi:L-alanine-DL-glutamate epimerase-like enolase superfamily enzyme